MNINEQLYKALELAAHFHRGQVDWNGIPSVLHLLRVMSNVTDIQTKCVAVLHDILEDTECTEAILLSSGISNSIVNSVKILTHSKKEDKIEEAYLLYIDKIIKSGDIDAIIVKKEDLIDNMSGGRVEPKKINTHIKCYSKHLRAMCMILEAERL